MQLTIAIAVKTLGIRIVKPCAPLANPFAVVPRITATINII